MQPKKSIHTLSVLGLLSGQSSEKSFLSSSKMLWTQQWQSVDWGQASVCALASYTLGCFTTGYYLVHARTGDDIRDVDSGNVGARNVSRVLGKSGFVLTLLGDMGKGALAVWAAFHYTSSIFITGISMLAVVAGHVWPVQLRFRGGKGAATSLGSLLAWDYRVILAFIAFFLAAFVLTRKTILPGLFAFACLPPAVFWMTRSGLSLTIVTTLVGIVLFAHRMNLVEEIPALAERLGLQAKPEKPKL
jgi:glycerol-3-phosphate acyltransferase PlsY